ncbi:MAG: IS5 family transposase [Prolixibacteraceae bacterium]
MVKYESPSQLKIEEFRTPFLKSLLPDNRWVKLSKVVPWDKFAKLYLKAMDTGTGRPAISPRIVLGALIIKHTESLDDRGTIAIIQENPYMQYFLGLEEFDPNPVFDPSLFVEIRKRIGHEQFDQLNIALIKSSSQSQDQKHNQSPKKKDDQGNPQNKGRLQMDATVADQYITYPTDPGILNECREKSEAMIDKLYKINDRKGTKPRTYRRNMRKAFLSYSKKKNHPKAEIRKIKHKLLESVKRNIKHIDRLLDSIEAKQSKFPLNVREQKLLWVIRAVFEQQNQMYKQDSNSCPNRIVNIYQPHVRPIPRGKARSKTEFGSKLGTSLDNGYARIDTFSWEAYNESTDLKLQVEAYRSIHGHYPELVQADRIYATRENREWLKERGIRITASPLGRPQAKATQTPYSRKKKREEAAERNQIEGKFGQGKNGYNLNQIRARLQKTSESWVACIFFIMNLIKYAGDFSLSKLLAYYLLTKQIISAKFSDSLECIVLPINLIDQSEPRRTCLKEWI